MDMNIVSDSMVLECQKRIDSLSKFRDECKVSVELAQDLANSIVMSDIDLKIMHKMLKDITETQSEFLKWEYRYIDQIAAIHQIRHGLRDHSIQMKEGDDIRTIFGSVLETQINGNSETHLKEIEDRLKVLETSISKKIGNKKHSNDEILDDDFAIENIIESKICPVTQREINNPVTAKCGHVFEKIAIEEYIKVKGQNKCKCPVAGCNFIVSLEGLARDVHTEFTRKRNEKESRKRKKAKNDTLVYDIFPTNYKYINL